MTGKWHRPTICIPPAALFIRDEARGISEHGSSSYAFRWCKTTRKSRIHELYFRNIYKGQEEQTQTFAIFMFLLKMAEILWY
jgi:hypothetical protein